MGMLTFGARIVVGRLRTHTGSEVFFTPHNSTVATTLWPYDRGGSTFNDASPPPAPPIPICVPSLRVIVTTSPETVMATTTLVSPSYKMPRIAGCGMSEAGCTGTEADIPLWIFPPQNCCRALMVVFGDRLPTGQKATLVPGEQDPPDTRLLTKRSTCEPGRHPLMIRYCWQA